MDDWSWDKCGHPSAPRSEHRLRAVDRKSLSASRYALNTEANVVDALTVRIHRTRDITVAVKWLYKLYEGVSRIEIGKANMRPREILRVDDWEAEAVAKMPEGDLGISYGDRDMV